MKALRFIQTQGFHYYFENLRRLGKLSELNVK